MKKRKIKWLNVVKAVIFLFCITMILHDVFMLTVGGWITGELYGWTWLGFITFILFCSIAGMIYDDFEEKIKSATNIETVTRTNTFSQKYINSIPQNKVK